MPLSDSGGDIATRIIDDDILPQALLNSYTNTIATSLRRYLAQTRRCC